MRLLNRIHKNSGQEDLRADTGKLRKRWRKIALATACFAILTPVVWSMSSHAGPSRANNRKAQRTALFSPKLQAGVGTEVVFGSNKSPLDQARDRVESIDTFITKRSGLRMDEATRVRLTQLEAATIERATKPVGIKEYVEALTETIVARTASLTDQDLDYSAATLKRNGGIRLRADGRFGLTEAEFSDQARDLRSMAASNPSAAIAIVGAALTDEITNRIAELRDGVPNQFAAVDSRGLTPAQAVLVMYSVLADDELALPSATLNRFAADVVSRRLALQTADSREAVAQPNPATVKAYGPEGRLFSAPVDLLFDEATLNGLLDRVSKGGN